MRKLLAIAVVMAGLAGCSDAQIASNNLSKAAEMFELERRIVFYNGITGGYLLTIEGRCSTEQLPNKLAVTCKTGEAKYKKHYLGLSDNVTYFSEQLEARDVSTYHYRVVFKPQTIMPDVDLRGNAKEIGEFSTKPIK